VCGVVGAKLLFGVGEGGWLPLFGLGWRFLSPRSCWRGVVLEVFLCSLGFVVVCFYS